MLPPTPISELKILDIVQDCRTGKKGVIFRMRPFGTADTEPVHVVMEDKEELWFGENELSFVKRALE